MAKINRMTRPQMIKVAQFLETIIGKPDKNGYVAYLGEWTDEKVAAHFGVTTFNVASLRKELHGQLSPGTGNNPLVAMWERLAKLEARITELEAHARPSLSERYNINTGPNGLSITSKT